MISAQFINVGTTISNDLQELKPTGDNITDVVNLQVLSESGQTVATYLWVNGSDLDTPVSGECWADLNYTAKSEGVKFGPGDGLWVTGGSTDQGLQSSGQVNTSDLVYRLRSGATGCGNAFPVSVDLQDILPSGDNITDVVNIQTLNEAGQTIDTYLWVNGSDLDTPVAGQCWADINYTEKTTGVTFEPGEGLWITGSSTAQYVTFPAPEL